MVNHYEILGVSQNATEKEIKKAYHKLAKSLMTDKWKRILLEEENFDCRDGRCGIVQAGTREYFFCSGPDGLCARTFQRVDEKWKQISEAYNTLSDPIEKRKYDVRLDRESRTSWASNSWRESQNSSSFFDFEKKYIISEIEIEFEIWSEIVKENELNPNLWNPYTNWKEKAEYLTTTELKNFKSQLLLALQQKVAEKKNVFIQRIETYLAAYVAEGVLQLKQISWENRGWKNHIASFWKMEDLVKKEKDLKEEVEEIVKTNRHNLQRTNLFSEKIQNHWKEKATEGKVNGKTPEAILKSTWKEEEKKILDYANNTKNDDLLNMHYDCFVNEVEWELHEEEKKNRRKS